MAKDNMQEQINEINRKLDLVLDEVMAQRETRQSLEDLTSDLTIVGNDVFKSTVAELENAGVELDGEARSEERRVGKECRSRWSPYH